MATELELKFDLPADALDACRAHPLLAAAPYVDRELVNRYFDTVDGALGARHWALRLRTGGDGRWVQTLKGRGSSANGVHLRSEWECDAPGGRLSLSAFDAAFGPGSADPMPADLRAVVGERIGDLDERFATNFHRRAWRVELADGAAEVALDVGAAIVRDAAGTVLASTPICELEIEQLDCSEAALNALANALRATLPLTPSSINKAQRGAALLAHTG